MIEMPVYRFAFSDSSYVEISIWIRMMDDSWIWDLDVLPFYLAIHEEFLR